MLVIVPEDCYATRAACDDHGVGAQRKEVPGSYILDQLLHGERGDFLFVHLNRIHHECPPSPELQRAPHQSPVLGAAKRQVVHIQMNRRLPLSYRHANLIQGLQRDVVSRDHVNEHTLGRKVATDPIERDRWLRLMYAGMPVPRQLRTREAGQRHLTREEPRGADRWEAYQKLAEGLSIA